MSYSPEAAQVSLGQSAKTAPYPLEERRHEIWRDIVSTYAPSLTSVEPSLIFAVPALPDAFPINVNTVRTNIVFDLKHSGKYQMDPLVPEAVSASVITARIAGLPDGNSHAVESQTDFLKRPLVSAIDDYIDLGLHRRDIRTQEGGVIFLPIETEESRNWGVFYNVSNIIGREGQPLLLKAFPKSLASLSFDISVHSDDDVIQKMKDDMREKGYEDLLGMNYLGADPESIFLQAMDVVLTNAKVCDYDKVKKDVWDAVHLLLRAYEFDGIHHPFLLDQSGDENAAVDNIGRLVEITECDPATFISLFHKAISLQVTTGELQKRFPHNFDQALRMFTAVTYLMRLNEDAIAKSATAQSDIVPVVSRRTLQTIGEEIRQLNADYSTNLKVVGLSDPVVAHESLHTLLAHLINRVRPATDKTRKILSNEEHVVEAMNIGLGHREAVMQCRYYTETPDDATDIEIISETFQEMTPEEREVRLRQYASEQIVI